MIASLNGRVVEKDGQSLVLEIGGVGLQVNVPAALLAEAQVGKMLALHTYLVVRETELTLYGFSSREARHFFTLLLGVSGVGPRIALAAISALDIDTMRRAVVSQTADVFASVPGIGKKTAQSILLHLQDKITAAEGLELAVSLEGVDSEVLAALTTLGYSVVEAQSALQAIPPDAPQELEERLRLALGYFGD
jgi:Holliday junction DNA helicase RuvA